MDNYEQRFIAAARASCVRSARRPQRGVLFLLHFSLSRLQRIGDTWTAIPH
jgi:hypothetical protein